MKPFLILQLRPETEAADDEFAAFLEKGGLGPDEVRRIRLDQENLPQDLNLSDYAGIIVGGGPGCVSDAPEGKDPIEAKIEAEILGLMPEITSKDIPFMGCCYGIGILGHHLGAEVSKRRYGEEVGAVTCSQTGIADPLLDGLPTEFDALVGHKEAVQELPVGCVHLLSAPDCPFQMIRYGRNVYATQFHPESDGMNFALRIRIYKDRGYFDPDEAETLITQISEITTPQAGALLARFVDRYRKGDRI